MRKFILRDEPHPSGLGGWQTVYKFPNNYGASVVSGGFFYTDNDHPFEVAVVHFDGESFNLDYSTPVTSDVIGHLNEAGVQDVLIQIKALPTKENDNGNS